MLAAHFYYGQSGYILAHISMTTRARDFKFAGAIVQRLYLVMVALTKNRSSAQYGWFCHGRSHIIVLTSVLVRGTTLHHVYFLVNWYACMCGFDITGVTPIPFCLLQRCSQDLT